MPVAGGPFIQKTGILLEVDAADKTSYSGTGTTWINQIRPGTYNGTLNNVSFDTNDSKGALVFTGSNTYVDFGNIGNVSSAWSFQVAFKPAATASGEPYTVLSYASGSDTGSITFKLDYSSSTQEVVLSTFSTASATARTVHVISGSALTGSWNIVHGTFGSQLAVLYVNGLGVAYGPTTGSLTGYNASNQLYAGASYGSDTGFYTGSIANITVNNADLDGSTVNKNYNALATRFSLPVRRPIVTDADAFAFVEVASISDTTQQSAINTLVLGLKANNLWTKMVAIYPFIGGSAFTHKFNLKNTGQYQITWSGGIIHNSLGINVDAINALGLTGIVPATALTTVESSHATVNFNTNSSASYATVFGTFDVNGSFDEARVLQIAHQSQGSPTSKLSAFQNTSEINSPLVGNGQGLWATTRTSATDTAAYRRSLVDNFSKTATSTVNNYFPSSQMRLLKGTLYDSTPGLIMNFATVGDGLTQTDVDNLYTILNTYNTTLSRL